MRRLFRLQTLILEEESTSTYHHGLWWYLRQWIRKTFRAISKCGMKRNFAICDNMYKSGEDYTKWSMFEGEMSTTKNLPSSQICVPWHNNFIPSIYFCMIINKKFLFPRHYIKRLVALILRLWKIGHFICLTLIQSVKCFH